MSKLVIHDVGRPVVLQDPVLPWNELTAEKKLTAESILEEVKTTLGWILDTHWLIIGLTLDQFFIRTASIIL
jgi:hypothetical protein